MTDDIDRLIERTTKASGVPLVVEDEAVLAQVADLAFPPVEPVANVTPTTKTA